MGMHPQARAVVEAMERRGDPDFTTITGAEARAIVAARAVAAVPAGLDVRSEDRTVPGPAGAIPVRVYWPKASAGATSSTSGLPILVWLHGGGWVTGTLDSQDATCHLLAHHSGAIVVSVDYRLAPEHPFPAGLDDSYAVAAWAATHGAEIGGEPRLVAVGGASAGANLAAAVTLKARDLAGPRLFHQLLVYPVTDCDFERDSYVRNGRGNGLTTEVMRWYWKQYAGDYNPTDPYLAVLRAEGYVGLPRAHVITAECDPLCDEGDEYAQRLEGDGVMTIHTRYPGMIHGFFGMVGTIDDATKAIVEAANQVRISAAMQR